MKTVNNYDFFFFNFENNMIYWIFFIILNDNFIPAYLDVKIITLSLSCQKLNFTRLNTINHKFEY